MNKRNTLHKKKYLIRDGDRFLAGFRLLSSGLDVGWSKLQSDAFVSESRQSVVAMKVLFNLSGQVEQVNY